MPRYLINSHILHSGQDPKACAEVATKILEKGKIKNVVAKACYCCTDEKRDALIVEGPESTTVLKTVH